MEWFSSSWLLSIRGFPKPEYLLLGMCKNLLGDVPLFCSRETLTAQCREASRPCHCCEGKTLREGGSAPVLNLDGRLVRRFFCHLPPLPGIIWRTVRAGNFLLFPFKSFFFWNSFKFMEKLQRYYGEFPSILYLASPNIKILHNYGIYILKLGKLLDYNTIDWTADSDFISFPTNVLSPSHNSVEAAVLHLDLTHFYVLVSRITPDRCSIYVDWERTGGNN